MNRIIPPVIEGYDNKTCPSCGKPQKLNVYCDGVCMEIASLKRRLEILYKKKFI